MKSAVISCAVEGNIMIALHASKSIGKVVIVLKEPDILMLLIQSCSMCTISKEWLLTLFRMGIFGAAHGWGGDTKTPLPKICHTYSAIMKLGIVMPYLKKIQKIYESRDTPLEFFWHQHFFTGNQEISLYQEIQI